MFLILFYVIWIIGLFMISITFHDHIEKHPKRLTLSIMFNVTIFITTILVSSFVKNC